MRAVGAALVAARPGRRNDAGVHHRGPGSRPGRQAQDCLGGATCPGPERCLREVPQRRHPARHQRRRVRAAGSQDRVPLAAAPPRRGQRGAGRDGARVRAGRRRRRHRGRRGPRLFRGRSFRRRIRRAPDAHRRDRPRVDRGRSGRADPHSPHDPSGGAGRSLGSLGADHLGGQQAAQHGTRRPADVPGDRGQRRDVQAPLRQPVWHRAVRVHRDDGADKPLLRRPHGRPGRLRLVRQGAGAAGRGLERPGCRLRGGPGARPRGGCRRLRGHAAGRGGRGRGFLRHLDRNPRRPAPRAFRADERSGPSSPMPAG